MCITFALALNEDNDAICSPREVLQALTQHRWRMDHQQQVRVEFSDMYTSNAFENGHIKDETVKNCNLHT